MNKVLLLGRLTKDPEVKYSTAQVCICSFTLAVNRKFVKEGEERKADFIMCKAFGKTAEFCGKYYSKGQQVAINGRIQTGSYEKDDGTKVYTTDVVVEDAYFAESKRENSGKGNEGGFHPVDDGVNDLPW